MNYGSVGGNVTKSANVPVSTSNRAPSALASETALDFGTNPGNYYVELDGSSGGSLDGLKGLSSFTLTGWLNARSLTTGSGGNRIISWINNGGDGVDLVVQANGSLRLGVDGWPDNSPAVSSANKVTADASAATQNWIFFAVTYQSNGQVKFYFGNSASDATLDVNKTYAGPGVTGSAIGKLAIGAFNSSTRNAATWDRMFRGVLDDIRVYSTALSLTNIVNVQRNLKDETVAEAPLLHLPLNDMGGGSPRSVGSVQGLVFKMGGGPPPHNAVLPASTNETPPLVGGTASASFGIVPGNSFIESQLPIDQLKNLSTFTITGWVNCQSSVTGSGGNRIVSWINNGGDGVDLVYQSDGSLRLGVDGWPDNSPAFSNPGKVTADANTPKSNWVFFAVTYESNGQVQYYFGTSAAAVTPDAARTYIGPGVTGSNIGKFAIGTFNSATRNAGTYDRKFKGLIDDIRVYGGSLSLSEIEVVQRLSYDVAPPTAPSNLALVSQDSTSVSFSWTASTDNFGILGYNIYDGGTLLWQTFGNNTSISFNYSGSNYSFSVRARDEAGNLSESSNVVGGKRLLIYMTFDEGRDQGRFRNHGAVGGYLYGGDIGRTTPRGSAPFSNTGKVFSLSPLASLKNLSGFTLMGWVNRTSNASPERILGWMPAGGGDGVELLLQTDGSLRLGIDALAESSPAVSSANKITTNASAPQTNWVFFAVTYNSTGETQFYFGNDTVNATTDVAVNYLGAGITGGNISNIYIQPPNGGFTDEVRIYNSVLTLPQIREFQYGIPDTIPPTTPGTLSVTTIGTTSVALKWSELAGDNVYVASYDVFEGSTLVTSFSPVVKEYPFGTFVGNLTPATTYKFSVKTRDKQGNYSPPTNVVEVTTLEDVPSPLIWLKLDEQTGVAASNAGSAGGSYNRSMDLPTASINVPTAISSVKSADFGTAPANAYVESPAPISELKNLSSFTITGWVNNRSNVMGSGGNRIVSWINHGGEGVDLVYQNDGSLRLGVDSWPDYSPAFSSANKVPTTIDGMWWVFFAVTYTESGSVEFYFGDNTMRASLDVTKSYPGRGASGANIGKLAIGNFNDVTRNASTIDRMFRGLIDDVRIYGTKLTPEQIIQVQGFKSVITGRLAKTPELVIEDEVKDETTLSQNYPNPFDDVTNVEVNIPHSVKVARMTVYDLTGRTLQNIVIEGRGPTSISVERGAMRSGVYIYSLTTDGKNVAYKRMMIK
ncbi:MAG: LamG-like jellyroll fold domain-containing protein [Chryseolinea sp.]